MGGTYIYSTPSLPTPISMVGFLLFDVLIDAHEGGEGYNEGLPQENFQKTCFQNAKKVKNLK
jgi:hypothetical protein